MRNHISTLNKGRRSMLAVVILLGLIAAAGAITWQAGAKGKTLEEAAISGPTEVPVDPETALEQQLALEAESRPAATHPVKPRVADGPTDSDFRGVEGAPAGPLFIGVDDATVPAYRVNVTNSNAVQAFVGFQVWGSAYDPVNNKVYFTNGSQLLEWPVGGSVTLLGTITDPGMTPLSMVGFAFHNGTLYGVRNIANEAIYVIDVNTRVATVHIDYADAELDCGGFAVHPGTGEFYCTNDQLTPHGRGLLKINPNGSVTPVAPYPMGQTDLDGLAISNDGKAYIVPDEPGSIYVWDLVGNTYLTPLTNPWTTSETFSAGAWIEQAPALGGCVPTVTTHTNNTPVAIPTGPAVVTSTLNVAGVGQYLTDVNLTTFMPHTFAADLDVTITSPSGTVVTLTTDNGAGNDNVFNGTVWDDDAPTTATDHVYANNTLASPLVPEEAMGAFIGENPNGTWTITISDDLAGDGGDLNSWSLQLSTLASPPSIASHPTATNATVTPITDVSTTTSTITIAGAGTSIHDVDLTTFIQHTFAADLDITLTSPAGTVVTLTTDNGAGNDNVFNGTIWNDNANPLGQVPYVTNNGLATDHAYVNLTLASPLVSEGAMGAFYGENPNGTWTLSITDDLAGDTGTLTSWSLDIDTFVCGGCPAPTVTTHTNNTAVAIPTGPAVVTSTLNVAGVGQYLTDVNLTTFMPHTFAADLDVTITSPSGTVVTLTTDNGAGNDNVFNGTVWDDSANPAGQVPYVTNNGLVTDHAYVDNTLASPLVPEEALGAFIGENPNGTWTITISDDLAGDGGSLNSWTLELSTLASPPTVTSHPTVTQNTAVAIPTGPSVVTSTVVVAGAGTSIHDVDLTTFITHTFAADLDVTITSPAGTVVTLTTDNGAGNDNVFNGTIWNDDANPAGQVPYVTNNGIATDHAYVNLSLASPLVPEEAMSAFFGENPNGTWTITISDDLAGDGGSLDSWSLDIDTFDCPPVPPTADLSITKTDNVTTVNAGAPITYTITASNAGPAAVTGATVTDNFPPQVTGITWTCTGAGGGTCPANGSGNINALVNLPAGGSVTFTATGTVAANAHGTLSNTATITPPGGVNDPNTGNNSATDSNTNIVPQADLAITKTDNRTNITPGQSTTYTIVVTNLGHHPAVNAIVTDIFPPGVVVDNWTCLPQNEALCTLAGAGNINDTVYIPVGGILTYTAVAQTATGQTGQLVNTATVTPPPTVFDPNMGNNTSTDIDNYVVSISGNVQQFVQGGPNTPLAGVTMTLSGSNAGTTTTDASGNYTFANLTSGGTWTVTPSMTGKVFDPVSRTVTGATANVTGVNFIAYNTGAVPRNIHILSPHAVPGSPVAVPIRMNSLGTENEVSFSIDYELERVHSPTVACGASAPNCTVTTNLSTLGKLGVTIKLPPLSVFGAGLREVAVITFQSNFGFAPPNTPLTFSDTPVARSVRDAQGNLLQATWTNGFIVFVDGVESDVAPRNQGDGNVLAPDVTQVRRFVAGLDTINPMFNEFQRTDAAPVFTLGDGALLPGDVVQARRYSSRLDNLQAAGGPTGPPPPDLSCMSYNAFTSAGSITPGTNDIGNHCDDCSTTVSLPFPVSTAYDATTYTSASISSNGTVNLTGNASNFGPQCPLPDNSFGRAIFAFQHDLRTDTPGSGIFTSISGVAPNRVFNIEWRTTYFGNALATANFQVRLFENSTNIDVIYGASADSGLGASSGVQSSATGPFTQFSCQTATLTSGTRVTYSCGGGTTRPQTEEADAGRRAIRVARVTADPGSTVTVPVELVPNGDETAVSFTLGYDPTRLTNPRVALTEGAPADAVVTINDKEIAKGRIGVLIDSMSPLASDSSARGMVMVTFDVAMGAKGGDARIELMDALAPRGISNALGVSLPSSFEDGAVVISGPIEPKLEIKGKSNGDIDPGPVGSFIKTGGIGIFDIYLRR